MDDLQKPVPRRYNTDAERREDRAKRQKAFNADTEHQAATEKFDRAFGMGRDGNAGGDYDASLTASRSFFFPERPSSRPLKQESWTEAVDRKRRGDEKPEIRETGSYAKGGIVHDPARGGPMLNSKSSRKTFR